MNEEIRNRNNELSDAALESVSGGGHSEKAQETCGKFCLSHTQPSSYSCTYEGGDWELLYNQMISNRVVEPGNYYPHTNRCPHLKRL